MMIQRKLSNGEYIPADNEQSVRLINQAAQYNHLSQQEVISLLETGSELRHGSEWYDSIRLAPTPAPKRQDPNFSNDGWVLNCGCTVYHRSHIMRASMGTACTDCYDRMSGENGI